MESSTAPRPSVDRVDDDRRHDGLAAERYGDRVGGTVQARRRVADVSYPRWARSSPRSRRGLIDLGLAAGDRVAAAVHDPRRVDLRGLRRSRSAGGVVVPIYPTNSPEECEWVAGNSESRFDRLRGRRAGREDRRGPRPAAAARGGHRDRRRRRRGDAISLDELRARGRGRDAAEVAARAAAVEPEDPYTFIYTSGTTGPPKGCVLSHGNYRAIARHVRGERASSTRATLVYLFLPLAHSFALLIQLDRDRPRRARSPTGAATRSRSCPS